MISLETVEHIHAILIERYGSSNGIRDLNGLEAALNRPYATFDSQELYPEAIDKAAAIFQSIVTNHPFIDGNKRTSYVMMRLTLRNSGFDIKASPSEKYEMVIAASMGKLNFEEIKEWLNKYLIKIK